MQGEISLFWLFFRLIVSALVAILGMNFLIYLQRARREEYKLKEVGWEMATKLNSQLVAISALRLKITVGVEQHYYGWRFWQRHHRILLTIYLPAAKNLRSVQTTAQQLANDYVAQPGCRNYLVRLAFKLLPEMGKGENQ